MGRGIKRQIKELPGQSLQKLEDQKKAQENVKQANKSVWDLIHEVESEVHQLKQAAEVNELQKTAKCYDDAMKNINKALIYVEKTETVRSKEEVNKTKPKREKAQPYSAIKVGVVVVDGKKKDKWEIQKTETSPVLTKYRAHKPEGLNEEQQEHIKKTLTELEEHIKTMQDDYTVQQYKTFISQCLYPKVDESKF